MFDALARTRVGAEDEEDGAAAQTPWVDKQFLEALPLARVLC
eukprot:SAG11_NODE_12183_length_717_cov_0.880259_2_plen_41_part_01